MSVWAIADLHLHFDAKSRGLPCNKRWGNHEERVATAWQAHIHADDLVLIAGDVSWASQLDEVKPDLEWIDALPGTKVFVKGNHDFWWSSTKKTKAILPPSIQLLHHGFEWNNIAIAGTRLWDDPSCDCSSLNEYVPQWSEHDRSIFCREVERLKRSLEALSPNAEMRIVMTHFPPIHAQMMTSEITLLFEEYSVDLAIFGHLHAVPLNKYYLGCKGKTSYLLTACDALNFIPVQVLDRVGNRILRCPEEKRS